MPADPGNKTDGTDLNAQHRAAVAGFGLCELELESPYRELQLRARNRRNLVEKAAAMACQIREHLHLAMPGFSRLFDHLLDNKSAMAIARRCASPAVVLELGHAGLTEHLRETMVRVQPRTIDKVLAWAGEMGPITHYANANAITGRCGLYPSRYQSDQTDNDCGPIIRQANRRMRCALMRISDNLVCHCGYYWTFANSG